MFRLDPTEGLSCEELLQDIFNVQMTPAQRAIVLGTAQARGCAWQDLFREVFEQYDVMMAEPVKREEWLRENDKIERRRAMPFGTDPHQGKGGAR